MANQNSIKPAPILKKLPDVALWRKSAAKQGEPCAVISGSFRILHPGNLHCIESAAGKFGGVCALVEPENGLPALDRAKLLALVRGIDAVVVLPENEIQSGLQSLRPYVPADCLAQPASTPLQKTARDSADKIYNIAPLKNCFARDIIGAVRSGQTPLEFPTAFSSEKPGQAPMEKLLAGLTGKRIVTVNGCFDLLHAGHAQLLSEAREKGDALIVLVNDDQSVQRYKGANHPVFPIQFRLAALKALKPVTAAYSFSGDNPLPMLKLIRPAIHVKGGSFIKERVESEKQLLESWGGRIEFIPLLEGFSSTNLRTVLKDL